MRALAIIIMVCMIIPPLFAQNADHLTGVTEGASWFIQRAEAYDVLHSDTTLQHLPGMKHTAKETAHMKSQEKKQQKLFDFLLGTAIVIGVIWYWGSGK